jgi:HK97 family phage prohead protease
MGAPVQTLRDLDIVRTAPVESVECRADEGSMPVMEVRFSPFETWYEIDSFWEGTFLERTVKGAFRKTMRENRDNIKVLFDHGHDFHIGNKVLGPIDDLREDKTGALGRVPLLDTSYNRDLLPGLEAGLYGSSFRFRVIRDEWNDEPGKSAHNPNGIPERTIKEVRLFEFGPVTFPANPAATAALRCATDDYYARLRSRDPERVEELLARARSIRTPDAGAVLLDEDTPAEGAATEPTDAPAPATRGLSTHVRARLLAVPSLALTGDRS